ncbi:MAG: LysR family transcriptional regulator [Caldilineaceae bacterium]|nr:LysR family transcriptional regulator [Caldilineaceae bacterium]
MEIHQLTYFVAVAETGGFSRAAQRCNVAQPSLSQQIIKLEREMGQPLFDRLGRTVKLTEAGQLLLPRARTILAEVQQIEQRLEKEISEGYGHLTVGFIPTIAPFLLPNVIQCFTDQYPHARLSVHEEFTDGLVNSLIDGKIDVGILSLPIHNKLIATEEICTERLLVASSRKHDLRPGTSLKPKELEGFPFIALSEIHCLGEQVHSFCYQQDVNLNIVCYTSQLSTVYNCVALGLGVSLVPQILAATDSARQIQYHTVSDVVPRRTIVAAVHHGRAQSLLARHFVALVRHEYRRLVSGPNQLNVDQGGS